MSPGTAANCVSTIVPPSLGSVPILAGDSRPGIRGCADLLRESRMSRRAGADAAPQRPGHDVGVEKEAVMTVLETPSTETLEAEHERLLDHVKHIRLAALELPSLSNEERHELLERIVFFLRGELAGHAEAEERALYPYVGRLLGSPRATATMEYDHAAIRRLTDRLAEA